MRKFIKIWTHNLFQCPTFWTIKPFYNCPSCNKGMRCYWQGNDVLAHGKDFCDKCAEKLEADE